MGLFINTLGQSPASHSDPNLQQLEEIHREEQMLEDVASQLPQRASQQLPQHLAAEAVGKTMPSNSPVRQTSTRSGSNNFRVESVTYASDSEGGADGGHRGVTNNTGFPQTSDIVRTQQARTHGMHAPEVRGANRLYRNEEDGEQLDLAAQEMTPMRHAGGNSIESRRLLQIHCTEDEDPATPGYYSVPIQMDEGANSGPREMESTVARRSLDMQGEHTEGSSSRS